MKIFALIFLFISLFSCTKKRITKENKLNLALTTTVSTLDPAVSYDTVSSKVVSQIYEALYEYDYLIRPYQIKPLIAKSLPLIQNNGLKYIIKINPGIYYHPHKSFKAKRREVVAQDFVNQIKRLAFKGTKSNGWWLFKNKIIGLDEFREKAGIKLDNFFRLKVKGLYAPDKYTLVIDLKKKYPQLIYTLAMAFTTPVSAEIIKSSNNDLSAIAIGTGPYKLLSWQRNSKIKLIKNTHYHEQKYPSNGDRTSYQKNLLQDAGKKLPFIDAIDFHIMKEASTRWLNFNDGKIDMMVLTKDHFPLALNKTGKISPHLLEKNIKLQISPTLTYWWLSFNMKDPILGKNLYLRKAIAHAVDINKYIKDFTNNIGLRANSIYPPGVPGYNPNSKLPYSYDISKAKKYMIKAGYPNGRGLPTFTYDVRGSSTVSRHMGEFIQKELSKIGIKLTVNLNTFPGFLRKARTGQLQIWQGGWAMDYPDPENIIQLLLSKNHAPGPNSSFYTNPKIDSLYGLLFSAKDPEEILKVTQKIEEIMVKDLPWIMQFYARNYILFHGRLKNFRQSDLINNNLKYLRVL